MSDMVTIGSRPQWRDPTRVHYSSFHNLFLYVTEDCQLSCRHCYMGQRLARKSLMSLEVAESVLRACRNLGSRYVTILGGEPTLHPELAEVVFLASTIGYEQITIDTNGVLAKRLAGIPPDLLRYVSVSLDGGTSTTHDDIRGEGSFRKALKGVQWLIENGYRVRLNCTVTKKSLHELNPLLEMAESLGISLVNFHAFTPEGNGRVSRDLDITAREWREFCAEVGPAAAAHKIAVWYPPTWASADEIATYAKEGFRGCLGVSLDRLSVFPDGRCYACSVYFDEDNAFARFRKGKFTMNRRESEYDLFCHAAYLAGDLLHGGCPAEGRLRDSAAAEAGLFSVCRCWKTHV